MNDHNGYYLLYIGEKEFLAMDTYYGAIERRENQIYLNRLLIYNGEHWVKIHHYYANINWIAIEISKERMEEKKKELSWRKKEDEVSL